MAPWLSIQIFKVRLEIICFLDFTEVRCVLGILLINTNEKVLSIQGKSSYQYKLKSLINTIFWENVHPFKISQYKWRKWFTIQNESYKYKWGNTDMNYWCHSVSLVQMHIWNIIQIIFKSFHCLTDLNYWFHLFNLVQIYMKYYAVNLLNFFHCVTYLTSWFHLEFTN